jgi:integrase
MQKAGLLLELSKVPGRFSLIASVIRDVVVRSQGYNVGAVIRGGKQEFRSSLKKRAALAALPRKHVRILTTEWGKPFTVDGFRESMRDAMTEAGLPLDCRPHGLRKTFGRPLADAGNRRITSWRRSVISH